MTVDNGWHDRSCADENLYVCRRGLDDVDDTLLVATGFVAVILVILLLVERLMTRYRDSQKCLK